MIILGINWEQNSSASLMIDGKIVGCSSEERFSRVKNDERYPKKAIDWLLKEYNVSTESIDEVCYISTVWAPGYILTRHYTSFSIDDYVNEQEKIWYPRIYKKKSISQIKIFEKKIDLKQYPGSKYWGPIVKKFKKKIDHVSNKEVIKDGQFIRSEIIKKHLNVSGNKIKFIDHSYGHAAYGYFGSTKSDSKKLVFTIDAFGDYLNYTCSVFSKKKNSYSVKKITKGSNFIIGRLYRYITLILGLKPNEHEYKVMGLAPYCKSKYYEDVLKIFKKFQKVKGLHFVDDQKPKDLYFAVKELIKNKRFDAIAGGLQAYSEILISEWISNCIKKTGISNICISGGVALNVKANYLVSKLKNVKNLHVPPSPDDASQSMGACYASYLDFYNTNKDKNIDPPQHIEDAYLGFDINSDEKSSLLKKIKKNKNYIIKKRNINYEAAKLLSKGKIIARAIGKAEFGARSLGNRSILADPSNPNIKKIINEKIKNRDFWMPFAASVLEQHAKKYFYLNSSADSYSYMTNCVETSQLGKKNFSAALHPYDETCRPQIIKKGSNKDYEDLINNFSKLTGIHGLLNTSFNIHGAPIINDIDDAINVFIKTNLDALIVPGYIIVKK